MAGLDFNSGKPVAIQGKMYAGEGCATISDRRGHLLFYTNGMTVWNRNGNEMLNGNGLDGSNISAQSGVIVPMPGDTNKFYIFTTHNWTDPQQDVQYNVVDMTLDGGLGGITSIKNVNMPVGGKEILTATYKDNCTDIWVIYHKYDSRDYYAYSITPKGVDVSNPVVSTIGTTHTGNNRYGYLKFSHDCKKLVCALGGSTSDETVEVFDFDTKSGIISNQLVIATANAVPTAYCAEFSPDNKMLYVVAVSRPNIYQYDLTLGSQAAIQASKTDIATGTDEKAVLQLGPDDKIYIAKRGYGTLDIINAPNKPGNACNYQHDAFTLASGTTGTIGLPNFINHNSSAFPITITANRGCGNLFTFNSLSDTAGFSCEWNFDDPSSGAANTSHAFHPGHLFKKAGVYNVTFSCQQGCKSAFASIQVATSKPGYSIDVLKDTFMFEGDIIKLDASSAGGSFYQWQDGSQKPTYTVTAPGTYWVLIMKDTCRFVDSIKVLKLFSTIGNKYYVSLCERKLTRLSARNPYHCLWSTGSTDSFIYVAQAGIYKVQMVGRDLGVIDTFIVTNAKTFHVSLGNDTTICEGNKISWNVGAGNDLKYKWQDGSTDSIYTSDKTGTYKVTLSNNCESKSDSVRIYVIPLIRLNLGVDTTICGGDKLMLHAGKGYGFQYNWQGGQADSIFTVDKPGTYWVTVKSPCGSKSDTIHIDTTDCALYVYVPTIFSPDGDGINDIFQPSLSHPVINYQLSIYNRWGERIFESNSQDKGWDGIFRGNPAMESMFLYQLHAVDKRHKTVNRAGRFYLIRH